MNRIAIKMYKLDDLIEDEYNVRTEFENLESLAESLKQDGNIQPIIVKKFGRKYIIQAGHRRFRAAKMAGLTELRGFEEDEATAAKNFVENMQRESLKTHEVYRYLEEQKKSKTQRQIAKEIGKPESYVSEHLKFSKLSKKTMEAYTSGRVTNIRRLLDMEANRKPQRPKVKKPLLMFKIKETKQLVELIVNEFPSEEGYVYIRHGKKKAKILFKDLAVEGMSHHN